MITDVIEQGINVAKDAAKMSLDAAMIRIQHKIHIELKLISDKFKDGTYPLPSKKDEDAGIDLRAMVEDPVILAPGEQLMVGTGIAIHINNPNLCAKIYPRSGTGKKGLVLGNLTGVIDSGYKNEIKLVLWNRSDEDILVDPGDRVAQMVLEQVYHPAFTVVDEFTQKSEREEKGYGSSGIK